jgi:secreted trypsin-like serine protease
LNFSNLSLVCGQINYDSAHQHVQSRVINGTQSYPHKYPWMIFMLFQSNGNWGALCGGSIISDKTILTAGKNYLNQKFLTIMFEFFSSLL